MQREAKRKRAFVPITVHAVSNGIVMTTVMNGYAFGLYGHVERFYQMGFVAAVWLAQLAWSPWWLARFRFGPFEWLWRSLTYWRRQPLRVAGGWPGVRA